MPIDITKAITLADGDELNVSISAYRQSFQYDVTRYPPDAAGDHVAEEMLARRSDREPEWSGAAQDIRGYCIKVCVTQGGETELSEYEILARFQIRRASGAVDELPVLQIAPGLPAGNYRWLTLQFQ